MKGYDFEVLVEEINSNKERALKKEQEEKEIRCKNKMTMVKYITITTLSLLIILTLIIAIQFKHKTIISTPYGSYQCRGKIIRICNGSEEAREYIQRSK